MAGYGTKKEFEALIEKVRGEIKAFNQKHNEINADPDLTREGKDKRIAEAHAALERVCKMHLTAAASLLNRVRKRLESERAAAGVQKTDDLAHQMRLSNAIKTLELRGRAMSDEELVQLVTPLAKDPLAKATIVAAASAGGRDPLRTGAAIDSLFAVGETRDKAVLELKSFEDFILGLWGRFGAEIGDFAVTVALDMRLEHWNADFTRYE